MKRNFALILAMLMLSSTLAACSETGDNNDNTKPSTESENVVADSVEEANEDPDARLDSGLEDADFEGYTFNIFRHSAVYDDFDAEDFTGEPINDAMWQRMKTIEDTANVTIVSNKVDADMRDGQSPLQTSVQAGTNDYDLVVLSAYSSCNALVANLLMDLNSIDNINLSQPWWDQKAVSDMSFNGSVFQATGDISIGDNRNTFCVYVNKTMAENYNLPNMYDMVRDGTWTIDNFRSLAEAIDANLDYNNNGNHVNDVEDIYGIYLWDDVMMGIVNASGVKCCEINDNGEIELTLGSEKFISAFEKFTTYAYNQDVTCAYQRYNYNADWGNIAFTEGRTLFKMYNLSAATEFREMEDDFGILPLPKYDELQEEYYNSCSSWALPLYSVPKGSLSKEELARTGWITEALAYEGKYTLTPAYYDQTLQNKVSRDADSSEMLDLIFETRCYDYGWYFEVGTYNEAIMNLLRSYSSDVSSMLKKFDKIATKTLDKYNEKIKETIGG